MRCLRRLTKTAATRVRSALPNLLDDARLRLLHTLDHLIARSASRVAIALRKHRALARNLLDVAGQDVRFQQTLHDLV
jgi:hypothetical protein